MEGQRCLHLRAGVFWMENLRGGQWDKHMIDDTWWQAHAMKMVDCTKAHHRLQRPRRRGNENRGGRSRSDEIRPLRIRDGARNAMQLWPTLNMIMAMPSAR
jgi:hypothetical protein